MKIGPVETNVKLDTSIRQHGGRKRIYPIYDMNVMESFLVTTRSEDEMHRAKSILSTLMATCNRKYGKKFTMRQIKKSRNKYQFRIWRIK